MRRWAALLCFLICIPSIETLHAQQPNNDDEVLKVSTDLLAFPIRVKDNRRAGPTALTESELSLKDDDHVTSGLFLYAGADQVSLVFALDQSGSLRELVSQQRDAALALFGKFGERSRVAILQFAQQPTLVAPFGRDTLAAREAFSFTARANQHTAIFDAALASVKLFDALPRARSERRIVILISDGLDNASRTRANSAIREALQKQVSFYLIHLPLFTPRDGRLAVRAPAKGFRELAEQTGGKYFLIGDASSALSPHADKTRNDFSSVFQAIEDDLKSQYLLGFYADERARDNREHRFSLSLPQNVEYQIPGKGYARTHHFFVRLPPPTDQ